LVRSQQGAPERKSQCLARAKPALGDQIVRIFRGKKKFLIPLKAEKKNFNHLIFVLQEAATAAF
jgi:hypothetical protein